VYRPLASTLSVSEFNCDISLQNALHIESSSDICCRQLPFELICSCSLHSSSRICFSCENFDSYSSIQQKVQYNERTEYHLNSDLQAKSTSIPPCQSTEAIFLHNPLLAYKNIKITLPAERPSMNFHRAGINMLIK